MNDIWILPSGEWIIYSDEQDIIKDFKSLANLEVVTTYHGLFTRHRASQFKFIDQDNLLRYICFKARFDYERVLSMQKCPGVGYNQKFGREIQQPSLLVEVEPKRVKSSKTHKKRIK